MRGLFLRLKEALGFELTQDELAAKKRGPGMASTFVFLGVAGPVLAPFFSRVLAHVPRAPLLVLGRVYTPTFSQITPHP